MSSPQPVAGALRPGKLRSSRTARFLPPKTLFPSGKALGPRGRVRQANVQGTVNLLQALAGDYRRFIFVGTSEIYGNIAVPFREDAQVNPISPYALTKYAAEQFCRIFGESYGWPIVMVRPFNAYGPRRRPTGSSRKSSSARCWARS